MAKFLNTTGVSYHLEELIKNTKDRLILISPYLQLHKRIKDHLENLSIQKHDIRIVYKGNKLQEEESNWLESQIGIRTSVCSTLHAKCYINENEAIVTSMNLYSFSQQNNEEMGIYITNENDPELYKQIADETQRLLTISEEGRISIEKVDKEKQPVAKKSEQPIKTKADNSKSNYHTTKDLSKTTGISSRKVNTWLTDNKLMYKKDDDWNTTKKGKQFGGIEEEGHYGRFVIWPEGIINHIAK